MSKVILAVDDDPLVLDVLSEMLEDLGCEVVRAESGFEALQQLQRDDRIHAMITDVNMHGMDGYELVWRAKAFRQDLQAIVVSGREPERRNGIPHIGKPFTQQDLQSVMSKTMGIC